MTHRNNTSWRIHLAARRPAQAVTVAALLVFALFGVAALVPREIGLIGLVVMLGLAALLLFGSIAEFLLPVTYTLDEDGAHMRHPGSHRLLQWGRVRRVYIRPDGIKLSPLPARTWAEAYRGVMLRTPHRDAVLADVRAWLADAGVDPEILQEES